MEERLNDDGVLRSASVQDGLQAGARALQPRPLAAGTPGVLLGSWVAETLTAAERAAAGHPEARALFFIRLYGVLTDVADFVTLTLDGPASHDGLSMFPRASGRAEASPLPMAMARVQALFDDEERLYIEYRRHAECDPFQLRYRARRRSGVAAQVPSALLEDRPFTVEHVEAALRGLLARHEHSEARLGSELARRSVPALRALLLAAG